MIEAVTRSESIGIGACATDQGVVALTSIERIGDVDHAFDDIVAAVAARDLEQFLDIGDLEHRPVEEAEQLDFVLGRAELVADPQGVGPVGDGDEKVVAVLREVDIVAGDPAAELDGVVDGDIDPAPVGPARPDAAVDDDILAVTDVELVDVPAVTPGEGIIARAAIEGFAEIRSLKRVAARRADNVDACRHQLGEGDSAVGKFEEFDRKGLHIVAIELVLDDDAFTRCPHHKDEV